MRQAVGTYEVVLRALEMANRKHGRACKASEVLDSMPPKDVQLLQDSYLKTVKQSVSHILTALLARGQVVVVPKPLASQNNYYAIPSLAVFQGDEIPGATSRRMRVLGLVREAAMYYGRAVRSFDVYQYAEANGLGGIDIKDVSRDMGSLGRVGELRVIPFRGDAKGFKSYLPVDLPLENYALAQPLTWLEHVRSVFESLWQEELKEADRACRRPRPISTSAIRARMASLPEIPVQVRQNWSIANSMQYLAGTSSAVVRRIDRGMFYLALWAPLTVPDRDLDTVNTYINDVERLSCALRRACERHDRPVTADEIEQEIRLDVALTLIGKKPVSYYTSLAAKKMLSDNGRRRRRSRRLVRRVGVINNVTYYWHDDDKGESAAAAYVDLLQIQREWTWLNAEQRIEKLSDCRLPRCAIGQALQVEAEILAVFEAVESLVVNRALNAKWESTAEDLHGSISIALERVRQWLNLHGTAVSNLPPSISQHLTGWTAEQLLKAIQPLYPAAQRIKQSHKLITMLYSKVLRVPNHAYTSRFCEDPHSASEHFFERTDSLLFAARQWGGDEAVFQAALATVELGRLRDARFVLPTLQDADFERRLTAVACLAFLSPTPDVLHALQRTSLEDTDFSVRAAAGWAHRLVTSEHDQLPDVLMG